MTCYSCQVMAGALWMVVGAGLVYAGLVVVALVALAVRWLTGGQGV